MPRKNTGPTGAGSIGKGTTKTLKSSAASAPKKAKGDRVDFTEFHFFNSGADSAHARFQVAGGQTEDVPPPGFKPPHPNAYRFVYAPPYITMVRAVRVWVQRPNRPADQRNETFQYPVRLIIATTTGVGNLTVDGYERVPSKSH